MRWVVLGFVFFFLKVDLFALEERASVHASQGEGRGRKRKCLVFVPGLCGPELQSASV